MSFRKLVSSFHSQSKYLNDPSHFCYCGWIFTFASSVQCQLSWIYFEFSTLYDFTNIFHCLCMANKLQCYNRTKILSSCKSFMKSSLAGNAHFPKHSVMSVHSHPLRKHNIFWYIAFQIKVPERKRSKYMKKMKSRIAGYWVHP